MNRLINSLARIKAIVFKEVKQLSRDRLTFGMIVMIPIIQLLLFGFAINTKLTNIPVGIVDLNQTSLSRYTQQAFVATQIVTIKKYYPTVRQAQQAITAGEVKAVLLIPEDLPSRFSQRRSYQKLKNQPQFANELRPIAQWIVDGTDPILANTIGGLSQMPLANIDLYFRNVNQVSPNFSVIKYFNPQGLSVINIVPGLVGIILTMTMIMFTSAAIVREKECGNHEFLITTPVKSMELMIGKILPYISIGLLQMTIILTLGHFVFHVPISGGLLSILMATLVFIFASLSLGLVVSTIAQTQLQSTQMTIFLLLPSILLSGFMFPYDGMPYAVQWLSEILPTTHFMRMIRAIVLRSATIMDVKKDVLWLVCFGSIFLVIASVRFKKKLD